MKNQIMIFMVFTQIKLTNKTDKTKKILTDKIKKNTFNNTIQILKTIYGITNSLTHI